METADYAGLEES